MKLAVLLLLSSLAFAEDLSSTLLEQERQFYTDWQQKKTVAFERILAPEAVAYGAYGNFDKAKQLELQVQANKNCDVKSIDFSKVSAKRLTNDTALLLYRTKQDALCGARYPVPSPITNASIYARRKGQWVNMFRASTPLPPVN